MIYVINMVNTGVIIDRNKITEIISMNEVKSQKSQESRES